MSRRAFYLINLGNNDDTCEKKKKLLHIPDANGIRIICSINQHRIKLETQ